MAPDCSLHNFRLRKIIKRSNLSFAQKYYFKLQSVKRLPPKLKKYNAINCSILRNLSIFMTKNFYNFKPKSFVCKVNILQFIGENTKRDKPRV